MAMKYCLCVVLTFLSVDSASARIRQSLVEIPIGAMLDHGAISAQAALEYKILQYNSQTDTDRHDLVSVDSNKFINMRDVYTTNTEFCELVKQGIFSIFCTHTVDTLDALLAYTSAFRMPFVTPRLTLNTTTKEHYAVFMQPYYADAIVDMIMHYEWTEIWYIHANNDGLIRMQQLFDALSRAEYVLKINVIRVLGVQDFLDNLQAIDVRRKEVPKRMLLDMSLRDCEEILKIVYNQYKSPLHHFFILDIGLSELNLTFFEHGGMNISGFRMCDVNNQTVYKYMKEWESEHRQTFKRIGERLTHEAAFTIDGIAVLARALSRLKATNFSEFSDYLTQADRSRNITRAMDCEADPVIPWKLGPTLMKMIKEIDFYGLTGRVAFNQRGLRRHYSIDIVETTTSMALSLVGKWMPGRGLKIQSPSIIRNKGNNMSANRTRIVTSILTEPFLMEHPKELNLTGNARYYGYISELVERVCRIIGVNCLIKIVKDNKFGSLHENGTWNGLMGELINMEADLAVAPLTITAVRERYIDFSKPFMSLGISIMIKKPEKEVPGVFSFMYPLSYEIWMCVIFAYIGVSVVLFLVSRFSPFEWHIEDNTDGPRVTNNFTIFNSLWFSLGAFMQQGVDIEPRSMSGRIVGSMWWFFTLIVISSYTANLAAFLTVQRMKSPIESAEDLAKQTEIKYGTVNSGSTKEFFRTSTIPTYERMWAFMSSAEPSVFVDGTEEGVKRVQKENGRYAFLMESTTNDYINQRKPCDTMKVGSNLDSKGYGIGTPIGSDLREHVSLAVLELRENGELTKLETEWWIDKGECGAEKGPSKQETTNALKLENVAGIFYILIGGLALGLVSAASEFLYNSKVESKKRQTTFMNAVRSKAHLSIKGEPERASSAVGEHTHLPPSLSVSTYTYTPAAQLITFDGYADTNTHTQV